MSTYIYCAKKSATAFELIQALGYKRLRRFDGMDFWDKNKRFSLLPNDTVICLDQGLGEIDGVRVLNGGFIEENEMKTLNTIFNSGIGCFTAYASNMTRWKGSTKYLPRMFGHKSGNDLLHPSGEADYIVVNEVLENEYRLHMFCGKSIRAGVKIPRDGFTVCESGDKWRPNANLAHPKVKTWDGGWRVKYDGFVSSPAQRKLASAACEVLKLDMGVVDVVTVSTDFSGPMLKVSQVTTCPKLDQAGLDLYAKAIRNWVDGRKQDDEEGEESKKPSGKDALKLAIEANRAARALKREKERGGLVNRMLNVPVQNYDFVVRAYNGQLIYQDDNAQPPLGQEFRNPFEVHGDDDQ